jgi:exonuclease III
MRLASWNLRKSRGNAPLCADHIDKVLCADLYFFQEVIEPDRYLTPHLKTPGSMIWEVKPQNKNREGTAIYSPRLAIERLDVAPFDGWMCAARVASDLGELCAISIHTPTRTQVLSTFDLSRDSCAYWLMERALPFIEQTFSGFDNVIIAGDTNCARATARLGKHFREAHLTFTERYGYTEALWTSNGERELPTWRRGRSRDWTMCNDHLFLRGPIGSHLVSADVCYLPDPPSDHAPIIAALSG